MSFRRVFSSSVGTKLLIGFTGLLLFAYLILHLVGNLMVFGGQEMFNHYAHMLVSNPLVIPAEIALLLFFALHIYKTVTMYVGNQRARPQGYEKKTWAGHRSRKSLASTTMIVTGIWLLLFIVIHLKTFKFGPWYDTPDGMRDLSRLVHEVYREPFHVAFYILSMVVVGMHLSWGLSSAFQSVGLEHPRYNGLIRGAGLAIAIVMAVGFALIPAVIYFGGRR